MLPPRAFTELLRAPHRQLPLADAALAGVLDGCSGLLETEDTEGARHGWHVCGGVLVGLQPANGNPECEVWVPAVLTPKLLRLLVGNQEATALVEAMCDAGD